MNKVGVVEIAREAGVSIATVSRVLNGSPRVSPSTRERVADVIERHGFRPNAAASDLRRGRSKTIGLAVANISQPWYAKLIRSMRAAISAHGYTTIVYDLEHSDSVLIERLESARGLHLSGMILATGDRIDSEAVQHALELLAQQMPLVVIGQPLPDASWPTLRFDDVAASKAAALEVLARRRAPVLFLGSSPRSYLASERMKGTRAALRKFPDVAKTSRFVRIAGPMDYASGYAHVEQLGARVRGFGALICVNDELALGASRALQDMGLRVPEDLMILGYGDIDFLPFVSPSLSSISGDASSVAQGAIDAVIARIAGEDVAAEHVFARRLIHRESTTLD